MFRFRKYRPRRAEIRKNRPDVGPLWKSLNAPGLAAALAIALGFWVVASGITTLREQIVRYRPRQYVHEDIRSRVDFWYENVELAIQLREAAKNSASRVYWTRPGAFDELEKLLLSLPEDPSQQARLDSATITALAKWHSESPDEYKKWVRNYIELLTEARDKGTLVVLPYDQRSEELRHPEREAVKVPSGTPGEMLAVKVSRTASNQPSVTERQELLSLIDPLAQQSFLLSAAASNIAGFTIDNLRPTHELNHDLTVREQNEAARNARLEHARTHYPEKATLVPRGMYVEPSAWKLLAREQKEYVAQLMWSERLLSHLGMAVIVALVTAAMAWYVTLYQPKVVRNPVRALALAGLLAAMLLLPQLSGIGTGPLLIFGAAPTILVAMILAIAYEQRFALGIALLHGVLVTAALGQGADFLIIMGAGVAMSCFLLDEVRTRQKLIEVGGAVALAMMAAAAAVGAINMDPLPVIGRNCLHVGAAGLGVGFVVLGILPFIEKAFRITTSMTLLELADASHPLLRRLQVEARGTYSHSLQVATLAEAAAEAIGANSLLCRAGSYYHDIGKMNKADYFVENQVDGRNRHLNLSPNVSLLIIIGHVKDGVELAKEYGLPPAIIPIIQQHHGTTLVEYFYQQACSKQDANYPNQPVVSDVQYRYPGPRPRSKETAIVMMADAAESATRAMVEPTAGRIEALVHDLIMKRLLDGQFDEAEITFRELELVERALVRTLVAIYHGRIAYPSTASATQSGTPAPATKTA